MKNLKSFSFAALLVAILSIVSTNLFASNSANPTTLSPAPTTVVEAAIPGTPDISGTWEVTITRGNVFRTDRTPYMSSISKTTTTMTVTQTGDEVTITFAGFGGYMSSHILKGRVGGGNLAAVLVSGTKSTYNIVGRAYPNSIRGEHYYIRYGKPSSGIVPGYTYLKFEAVRK